MRTIRKLIHNTQVYVESLFGDISTFDDDDCDGEDNCDQNQHDEKENPAVDITLVFGHSRHLFAD